MFLVVEVQEFGKKYWRKYQKSFIDKHTSKTCMLIDSDTSEIWIRNYFFIVILDSCAALK